jgi:hypothetical protein
MMQVGRMDNHAQFAAALNQHPQQGHRIRPA